MVSEGPTSPVGLRERRIAQAKQVAGRLCLDFANTVGGWRPAAAQGAPAGVRDERLHDYADLLAWCCRAGTLDDDGAQRLLRESARRPQEADAVRERALRLRDAVHAIAWSFVRGEPPRPAALQVLASEVRAARERQRLERADGRLAWRLVPDSRTLDLPLWPIALSAEDYFTGADLTRLHVCPGEECGWLFEDTSRNRSRQWCDMGDCGNVAKVRRFRSRQARQRRKKSSS
jgi:predicted RNA-binding Zn ribbon-like protein